MTLEKRELDWAAAKERLARAGASLEESITTAPARAAEILEARARRLAQSREVEDTRPRLRVLRFRVGAESYALEVSHVRGVLRLTQLTPLPDAPPHAIGMTNVRGEILPLFDLRQLMGRGTAALTDLAQIIVVGREQLELGLVADEAKDIVDLPLDDILPTSISGANRELVRGISREALTVLDGAALCRDPRLFITTGPREE